MNVKLLRGSQRERYGLQALSLKANTRKTCQSLYAYLPRHFLPSTPEEVQGCDRGPIERGAQAVISSTSRLLIE